MRFWLLAAAAALTGCGSKASHTGDGQRRPHLRQLEPDAAFAEEYFVDDLSCMQGAAAPLSGPGVLQGLFGYKQRQTCAEDGCGSHHEVLDPQKPLKICEPGREYPRASVEGAGRASQALLAKAHAFYASLPNRAASLPSAQLMVLPTVEKIFTAADGAISRTVLADNLAYSPSFGGQPMFIVFPKSRRAAKQGLWKDVNLWEVPWGMAHEFGHHVFRQHTGRTGLDVELSPIRSFDMAPAAGPTPDDYWTAVNEGFADLFAYYALGGAAGLVAHVDCFKVNREVSEAKFTTGDAKVVDASLVARFEAPRAGGSPDCTKPSFQDVHTLGAAIAHAVDKIFSSTTKDPARKAALLLDWATRLGVAAEGRANAEITLPFLLQLALSSAAQCEAARQYVPAYAGAWDLCDNR